MCAAALGNLYFKNKQTKMSENNKWFNVLLGDIRAAQRELEVHKINMETNSGRTALMFAAQYGR